MLFSYQTIGSNAQSIHFERVDKQSMRGDKSEKVKVRDHMESDKNHTRVRDFSKKKKDGVRTRDNMSMVGNDGSVKSRSLKGKLKPRGHDALAQRGRNKNDDDDSVND